MVEFSNDMELIDFHLEGGSYAWFNGDAHVVASRIDRILISAEWNDLFNNLKQSTLQKLTSDMFQLLSFLATGNIPNLFLNSRIGG